MSAFTSPNVLPDRGQMAPYHDGIVGLVVESTYNWYWLVDGLMAAGYQVHRANTAVIVQYQALQYNNDDSDARWLAKLLRLKLLPEGYIYPKAERAVRDLLRKRSQWVPQRTSNLLSVQNLLARNRGESLTANAVKRLSPEAVDELLPEAHLAFAVKSTLAVMRALEEQITVLEKTSKAHIEPRGWTPPSAVSHRPVKRSSTTATTLGQATVPRIFRGSRSRVPPLSGAAPKP